MACWAAPSPGVLVTAPDITPVMVLRSSPTTPWIMRVTATARRTSVTASRFILTPPFLKDWKNPGPTCRPMENTKSMRPKSLTKARAPGSARSPKWLNRMPTKSIHVEPIETPLTLNLPSQSPVAMTKAKSIMEWASPVPVNNSLI